jgi:integrase
MRAEECLSLQIKDISIQEEGIKLLVTGKGNKQRILYLNIAFLPYIKKMLDLRERYSIKSKYFFATKNNKKSTIQGLYRANKSLLKLVNIKDKRKSGLHTYRHTFATLLVNADVNMETIKEILGHSNILTTSRYYAKANEKAKKRSMLKVQELK